MDKNLRDSLISRVQHRHFEPGQTILQQGDPAQAFYILLKGNVDVFRSDDGAEPHKIDRLSEGDFFGEIGLLYEVPRTATVRVEENRPAEVLVIDHDTFADFVIKSDLTADEIAAIVKQRLININLANALPSLSPQEIYRVSPRFEILDFDPEEIIIRQGAAADKFYILTDGRVGVLYESPNGPCALEWLEPGEYFGEIGLLRDRPRTATVRAAEDNKVTVMALDRQGFEEMLQSSKATEMDVAGEMARNLIQLANVDER